MKYTQQSRAGKARENEDRLMVKELSPDTLLAVMADGMGGLDHGEIAAETEFALDLLVVNPE